MRLYPLAPDPEAVRRHFTKMARGEIKSMNGQSGFGFAGSRVRLGGGSILSRQKGETGQGVTVERMTPSEVGVRQARSQLLAEELNRKSSIKRDGSASSRQKLGRKRRGNTSVTAGKKRKLDVKKKKKKKQQQQKKKGKLGGRTQQQQKKKKSVKKKGKRVRDNFS